MLVLGLSRIWSLPHLQHSADRILACEPPVWDPTVLIVRLLGREFTLSSDFPRGLSPKEGCKSLFIRILNIDPETFLGNQPDCARPHASCFYLKAQWGREDGEWGEAALVPRGGAVLAISSEILW